MAAPVVPWITMAHRGSRIYIWGTISLRQTNWFAMREWKKPGTNMVSAFLHLIRIQSANNQNLCWFCHQDWFSQNAFVTGSFSLEVASLR
jgi:hypothetical protein